MEFFLVHPGGPYFRKKDAGFWSIPKGLVEGAEEGLETAQRELVEETGFELPAGPWIALGQIRQRSTKIVHAWAVAAPDFDPSTSRSDTFEIEWPPRSGRMQRFLEVDRADWFDRASAEQKLIAAQIPFLERAEAKRREIFGS